MRLSTWCFAFVISLRKSHLLQKHITLNTQPALTPNKDHAKPRHYSPPPSARKYHFFPSTTSLAKAKPCSVSCNGAGRCRMLHGLEIRQTLIILIFNFGEARNLSSRFATNCRGRSRLCFVAQYRGEAAPHRLHADSINCLCGYLSTGSPQHPSLTLMVCAPFEDTRSNRTGKSAGDRTTKPFLVPYQITVAPPSAH